MGPHFEFDREKFREIVLFVAQESEEDPRFGATKLNKILYFSDFKAFAISGEPITGATYRRLDRGPAPLEILPVLREMEREGEIEIVERRYFNLRQRRIKPLRSPDLSRIAADQVDLVRSVIAELRVLNAAQVSVLSHLEIGWQVARDREVIPYYSAYVSDRKPSARELSARKQVASGERSDRSA